MDEKNKKKGEEKSRSGMRSKWSDDEDKDSGKDDKKENKSKTDDGKMLPRVLHQPTPAKDTSKVNPEGAENVMMQEFSPKFTFG